MSRRTNEFPIIEAKAMMVSPIMFRRYIKDVSVLVSPVEFDILQELARSYSQTVVMWKRKN